MPYNPVTLCGDLRMYSFAANILFLMLALLAFCPTRVSKRPLLLPCIENSHVITDYPVVLVSLYSAAVNISSVHILKDGRRGEGERLTHKSS
jgi:hypothetical protein